MLNKNEKIENKFKESKSKNLFQDTLTDFKYFIKLIAIFPLFILFVFLTLLKKLPFLNPKILFSFIKKIESYGSFTASIKILHQSPRLTKLAKFIYLKFPNFSRFILKIFKIYDRDPLDLKLAIRAKKNPSVIKNEIDIFYEDLKIALNRNKKK